MTNATCSQNYVELFIFFDQQSKKKKKKKLFSFEKLELENIDVIYGVKIWCN